MSRAAYTAPGSRIVPLEGGDDCDRALVAMGFRRTSTPRLRALLARTRHHITPILRARRDSGRPIDGFALALTWRRSNGDWRLVNATDTEGLSESEVWKPRALVLGRNLAYTCAETRPVLAGPVEAMIGDTVVLSAWDRERVTFAHDHVAIVGADGSVGELVPAIVAKLAGGAS